MITLEFAYVLGGLILASVAVLTVRDRTNPRRHTSALFWGLYAASFLFGSHLPPIANGVLAITLAILVGFGGVRAGRSDETPLVTRSQRADRLGNLLFGPALAIPAITLGFALGGKYLTLGGRAVLATADQTLIGLAIASISALILGLLLTRDPGHTAVRQTQRLIATVGWAAMLPQLLATLGALFAAAGVGDVIAQGVVTILPADSRLLVVIAYLVGMALLTIIMGNAFAAFPVMTAGIGIPLIVKHGGDPAVLAAIGMASGYCGTLMTPMAANYNIVPATLLDLSDKYAIVRLQILSGVLLLSTNIILMQILVW